MVNRPPHRYTWNLKALRTFEVSARLGSFAAAAKELFVTQGAVSKQIKNLEVELDFDLFQRRGNSTSLTREGFELSEYLKNMFADLEDHIGIIANKSSDAPIVISCEPTICLKLLIQLLPEIQRDTGVSTNILSDGGPVDFRRNWIDFAIRRADFEISNELYVEDLGRELVGPVHSPAFRLAKGKEKAAFTRVHAGTRKEAWAVWNARYGDLGMTEDVSYEHHYLALEAAESAQGVAMASIFMSERSLARGTLVAPRGFCPDGSHYVCLSHTPFDADERKSAVVEWLKNRFDVIRKASV